MNRAGTQVEVRVLANETIGFLELGFGAKYDSVRLRYASQPEGPNVAGAQGLPVGPNVRESIPIETQLRIGLERFPNLSESRGLVQVIVLQEGQHGALTLSNALSDLGRNWDLVAANPMDALPLEASIDRFIREILHDDDLESISVQVLLEETVDCRGQVLPSVVREDNDRNGRCRQVRLGFRLV
ncbi:MAG: hypothetical protein ABR888_05865 [Thermoplasmata archaeon]|jgi:hypothetical protein